ncbi:MAG TPA: DUF4340 domain-containing protein [Planctomycetes bacterium]|nr:DUF4340 domain-containing protein [Planctomycetota bacterium]
MSNKKLTILGIVAIVMVILAGVQMRLSDTHPSATLSGPTYLIQGLDTNKIASIVLGKGDEQIILTRSGNRFVVANKDDYPAKTTEINGVIAACLDIKTAEFITDNPANHADLGVTEAEADHIVKLFGSDGNPIIGLLMSPPDPDKNGSYVRLISSNDVYLTLGRSWPASFSDIDFIDTLLLNVNRDKIKSVTVTYPDESYNLSKSDTGVIELTNIPEGKKLREAVSDPVFNAVENLTFDDVTKDASDLKFESTYISRLDDSTVYTLSVAEKDGKTYVKCQAEFTDHTIVTKDEEVESEEELKKKEAILLARDSARSFNEKHTGWIYQIPGYKADNITKKSEDLLEDKVEENAGEQTEDSGRDD